MSKIPSPVVTTPGAATPVVARLSTPAVVSEPLPAHVPEELSIEAMPVCHLPYSHLSIH
jgi:hypothetical protein